MLQEERDDEEKRSSKKMTAVESRMIGTISRTSRRWKNDGDAGLLGKEMARELARKARQHRAGYFDYR